MKTTYSFRRTMLIFAIVFAPVVLQAQTAKLIVSSKAGDRLAAKPDAQFTAAKPAGGAIFQIDEAVRLQKIDGFGLLSWRRDSSP